MVHKPSSPRVLSSKATITRIRRFKNPSTHSPMLANKSLLHLRLPLRAKVKVRGIHAGKTCIVTYGSVRGNMVSCKKAAGTSMRYPQIERHWPLLNYRIVGPPGIETSGIRVRETDDTVPSGGDMLKFERDGGEERRIALREGAFGR